jgi:hypothetical protein
LEVEANGEAEEVDANGEAEDENAPNVDCGFLVGTAGAGAAGFSDSGGGCTSVHHPIRDESGTYRWRFLNPLWG